MVSVHMLLRELLLYAQNVSVSFYKVLLLLPSIFHDILPIDFVRQTSRSQLDSGDGFAPNTTNSPF